MQELGYKQPSIAEICCGDCLRQQQIYRGVLQTETNHGLGTSSMSYTGKQRRFSGRSKFQQSLVIRVVSYVEDLNMDKDEMKFQQSLVIRVVSYGP